MEKLKMSKIEKHKMSIFVVLNLLLTIGMNLGHPVTPTLIKSLGLPPRVFGISFAAMCFSNFIFALVWSNVANGMKKSRILMISAIGYALTQIMFGYSTTELQIYGARLLSGIFAGGFQVGLMSYVVNESPEDSQARYITINSILISVGAALGFFLGGMIGDISVRLTFVIQAILDVVVGVAMYLLLGPYESVEEHLELSMIKDSNPLNIVKKSKHLLRDIILILMIVNLVSSIGVTLFDQSFNYYIKDIFNFKPSQNGLIKAVTGVFALVLNVILIRMGRKKKGQESILIVVLLIMGVTSLWVANLRTAAMFVGISLIWFGVYTMMIPLLQNSIIARKHSVEEGNQISGLYNSVLMLGKIAGALLTSYTYSKNPLSPFWVAGVAFLFSGCLLIFGKKKYQS